MGMPPEELSARGPYTKVLLEVFPESQDSNFETIPLFARAGDLVMRSITFCGYCVERLFSIPLRQFFYRMSICWVRQTDMTHSLP